MVNENYKMLLLSDVQPHKILTILSFSIEPIGGSRVGGVGIVPQHEAWNGPIVPTETGQTLKDRIVAGIKFSLPGLLASWSLMM